MGVNRGKEFEDVIRKAFERVPNTSVVRLPDPVQGYLGVRNHCDFIVYHKPYEYHIECKSVHGNTLSIYSNDPKKKYGNITNNQWEGLMEKSMLDGVFAGIICWWVDKNTTVYIPIGQLQREREAGKKSVRWDCVLNSDFQCIPIAGTKKRVFFDYDMDAFFHTTSVYKCQ